MISRYFYGKFLIAFYTVSETDPAKSGSACGVIYIYSTLYNTDSQSQVLRCHLHLHYTIHTRKVKFCGVIYIYIIQYRLAKSSSVVSSTYTLYNKDLQSQVLRCHLLVHIHYTIQACRVKFCGDIDTRTL